METYEETSAKVAKLEAEIESLSKNLLSIEKKLSEIDYQILSIIKRCVEDPSLIPNYSQQQKKLQEEEVTEFKKYIELRKTKDALVLELRDSYAKFIKLYHRKRFESNNNVIQPVDLSTSQLVSGTMLFKDEADDMSIFLSTNCWIPDSDITLGVRPDQFLTPSLKEKALLGEGESTKVYRGVCRGKQVAVKVLSKEFENDDALELFRKECKQLKEIVGHPNLLLFMGACLEQGKYKIVMEWARNGSLEAVIRSKKQQFSFKRKITMMKEICTGMSWLHSQNPPVLHLNLKPSNILLSSNWSVKIADYGLGQNRRTIQNNALPYTAPELLKKSIPTVKSDIYSCGVLIWYILTEKDPFINSGALSSLFKDTNQFQDHIIENGRPSIPPSTPPSIKDLITRCWDTDPSKRPTFPDILKEDKWEKMIIEGSTHGDKDGAMTVWMNLGNMPSVQWKDFVRAFAGFLEIPNSSDPELQNRIEWQCLYALLEVTNDTVLQTNYLRFLSFFGPVRTGPKEGMVWLNEIKTLLSQKWFHGPIDSRVAFNRIVAQSQNSQKGSILKHSNGSGLIVRFSNQETTFTMTFRKPKDKDCHNIRLEKPTHFRDIPSLISYVENTLKKLNLHPTSYERMYQDIFNKEKNKIQQGVSVGNYTDDFEDKKKHK